jgi:hypothetical protein
MVYLQYNAFRDMKTSGSKVPEIYHAFEFEDKGKEPVTYIVMEYVLTPDGLRLGPVQRGHINHTLFTEDGACAEYESVDHLQRHFNKVYAVPLNIPSVNTRLRYCTYTSHTVLGAQGGNTWQEGRLLQRGNYTSVNPTVSHSTTFLSPRAINCESSISSMPLSYRQPS